MDLQKKTNSINVATVYFLTKLNITALSMIYLSAFLFVLFVTIIYFPAYMVSF